jgi:NAD(P)H dehydrogenase (quinone)
MSKDSQRRQKARVLVLGATGGTGGALAGLLDAEDRVEVVRAARHPGQVAAWQAERKAAVFIDLDDPRTFPAALTGIDRLFVMNGYTIHMVHQVKTITDAAADAGVGFIVHLGVFGNGRSTDPHFAWHELVERYIEGSGVAWCHLHPHVFMENLLTTQRIIDNKFIWPMGDRRVGWIAGDDLTAVAAKVLADGPERHGGANHYMSTDVLNGTEVAAVLSEVLGRPITPVVTTPEYLEKAVSSGTVTFPIKIEANYGASMLEWARQTYDGRMEYSAVTTDTVATLLGRPPMSLAQWAKRNRGALDG